MIEFSSFALSVAAFTQMEEQNSMFSTPPSGSSPVFSVCNPLASQLYKAFPELYEQNKA